MVTLLIAAGFLLLVNLKILKGDFTEGVPKSIKALFVQKTYGNIIDANVGRFIKLREHTPNKIKYERPDVAYMKAVAPNTLERKKYLVRTDEEGFIKGPIQAHENPELKIVFLGGSTTECLFMDEDKRFPYLVGQTLEGDLNKRVNTYNGGVSANETMHALNILMNKVLPMKPDVVVLKENVNDLSVLRAFGDYGYKDSLKSHVQTSKNVFTRHEFPPIRRAASDAAIVAEFTANLKTFIAINKIRQIKPVLMTQANRDITDALYHQLNQAIRDVASLEQVALVDLDRLIPKNTQHLYDPYHYTAHGSQVASMHISSVLSYILKEG